VGQLADLAALSRTSSASMKRRSSGSSRC
jgi:hypothetical protein